MTTVLPFMSSLAIPLLEIDLRSARQLRGVSARAGDRGRQLLRQALGAISGTDHRPERLDQAAGA
jgi:hypothetical protein